MFHSERVFLSFIIPLYNCEKYIGRCLESIINATKNLTDIEIIIVNDGSSDNSELICSHYLDKHLSIRMYTQKNKGASSARNYGLSKTCGKYVWFVDADDTISVNDFTPIYTYLNCVHPDIITFNYYEESYSGIEKRVTIPKKLIQSTINYLHENNRLYLWDKIYSKHLIGQTNFLDGTKNIEDFLFNIEILLKDHQIHKLPYIGYVYNTKNATSTSRSRSKRNLLKISSDSFRVHLRLKQIISEASIENQKILEDLLYFGIGGHLYSLLRFYNFNYLFKAIKFYKDHNLYPLKFTTNIKMNIFILVINRLWGIRFLTKK